MTGEITNIINDNKNLIYSITHYFKGYQNKEDLFQVGCVGMINAYKNYDNSMGVKFTTYAYPYILGEMKKYVNQDHGIKISRDILKLNLKIDKATILLSQKFMREPTISEIASYLEVPEDLIGQSINTRNIIQSFDDPINNNDAKEMTLHDTIAKVETMDLNSLLDLKKEVSKLDDASKDIIKMRYYDDLTQTEVANALGINQVQVSRKEQKILQKLKNKLSA
ncbi:MAG: sigma-70 family RNA polymerase sigma factor [Bacilli bacterium]|nr:sigma-70 family RNA polymerase sigma factor [Bacilli bacterium]MDD4548044.1 sigma-70 family RNA polymerase sigma factor [Bacilli bacterium]